MDVIDTQYGILLFTLLQWSQHETSVLEETFKQIILSTRNSFIHILATEEEILILIPTSRGFKLSHFRSDCLRLFSSLPVICMIKSE